MNRFALLIPLFLCSGCATLFPSSATYIPIIAEVKDALQTAKDLKVCHDVADNYKPGLSTSTITQSTVTGATDNFAYGVINPLVPAAGAAGGAISGTVTGLGLNGQSSIKILVHCLRNESNVDHAFILADPNE